MTMNLLRFDMTAHSQAIHGETALHLAFAADRDDCVRYLLSAGADIEIKDRHVRFKCVAVHVFTPSRFDLLPMTISGPSMSHVIDGVGLQRKQDFHV